MVWVSSRDHETDKGRKRKIHWGGGEVGETKEKARNEDRRRERMKDANKESDNNVVSS